MKCPRAAVLVVAFCAGAGLMAPMPTLMRRVSVHHQMRGGFGKLCQARSHHVGDQDGHDLNNTTQGRAYCSTQEVTTRATFAFVGLSNQ